jgi:hypothetical protein
MAMSRTSIRTFAKSGVSIGRSRRGFWPGGIVRAGLYARVLTPMASRRSEAHRGNIQNFKPAMSREPGPSVEPNFHQVAWVSLKFAPLDPLDDIGQCSVRGRPDADLLALACYQAVY